MQTVMQALTRKIEKGSAGLQCPAASSGLQDLSSSGVPGSWREGTLRHRLPHGTSLSLAPSRLATPFFLNTLSAIDV